MVTTYTFNNCDWSGRETTLRYQKKTGRFRLNDEEYFLKENYGEDGEMTYQVIDSKTGVALFEVYQEFHSKTWVAICYDYTREAEHPVVAAAQMILFTV